MLPPESNPEASSGESRLLLVSNRLPITIRRSEDGRYQFSMSSGGLVTGLSGLAKTRTFQWYGWPGLEVPEDEIGSVKQRLKDEFNATPVFIDDELADRHYNGFSSMLHNMHFRSFIGRRIPGLMLAFQTLSCGHCYTTIPAKLSLTRLLGMPIKRLIFSSREPSPAKPEMGT